MGKSRAALECKLEKSPPCISDCAAATAARPVIRRATPECWLSVHSPPAPTGLLSPPCPLGSNLQRPTEQPLFSMHPTRHRPRQPASTPNHVFAAPPRPSIRAVFSQCFIPFHPLLHSCYLGHASIHMLSLDRHKQYPSSQVIAIPP